MPYWCPLPDKVNRNIWPIECSRKVGFPRSHKTNLIGTPSRKPSNSRGQKQKKHQRALTTQRALMFFYKETEALSDERQVGPLYFFNLDQLVLLVGDLLGRFFSNDVPFSFLDAVVVIGHYRNLTALVIADPLIVEFLVFEITDFPDHAIIMIIGGFDKVILFFKGRFIFLGESNTG